MSALTIDTFHYTYYGKLFSNDSSINVHRLPKRFRFKRNYNNIIYKFCSLVRMRFYTSRLLPSYTYNNNDAYFYRINWKWKRARLKSKWYWNKKKMIYIGYLCVLKNECVSEQDSEITLYYVWVLPFSVYT